MNSNTPKGHIVAMGGGGFSMEPDNPLLDDFILSLANRQPARVCFVPTASADSAMYIVRFYRAFSGRAIPTDLTIFDPSGLPRHPSCTAELASFIAAQDIFYVGGGNTVNLLAIWRAHGLDKLLHNAWMNGAVLCGVSAGMICWFQGGITDSYGNLATIKDGLGFIAGSTCPHYDSEEDRRPAYHQFIKEGLYGGYAVDDGAALHFHGTELKQIVSSRAGAAAYKVEVVNGQVIEKRLGTRFLGNSAKMA